MMTETSRSSGIVAVACDRTRTLFHSSRWPAGSLEPAGQSTRATSCVSLRLRLWLLDRHAVIAGLALLERGVAVGDDHHPAALGAALAGRFRPGGEVALRVTLAAIEDAPALGAPLNQLALLTLRAGHTDTLQVRRGVAAVRETAAADELAELAQLVDQRLAALRAHLAGRLVADLDLLHRLLGLAELGREGLPELVEHRHPLALAGRDLIELLLEARGELQIDDRREVLHQDVVDHEAQLGRHQPPVFHRDVVARDDVLNRRRVGARAADAVLLERLDQRGLGVARRRLGPVLLGQQARQV